MASLRTNYINTDEITPSLRPWNSKFQNVQCYLVFPIFCSLPLGQLLTVFREITIWISVCMPVWMWYLNTDSLCGTISSWLYLCLFWLSIGGSSWYLSTFALLGLFITLTCWPPWSGRASCGTWKIRTFAQIYGHMRVLNLDLNQCSERWKDNC